MRQGQIPGEPEIQRQKNHVLCVIRGHFQVVGPAVERRIAARWIAMIGIMKRGRSSCRVSRRVSRESYYVEDVVLCVSEEVPIKLNHKCFTDVVPVIPREHARDSRTGE